MTAPNWFVVDAAGWRKKNTISATEILRRDKEARRRRCRGASQRSDDAVSAKKIGAAAGVDHE
jgi:hypothetical protein